MALTSPLWNLFPEKPAGEEEAAFFFGDISCIKLNLFGL